MFEAGAYGRVYDFRNIYGTFKFLKRWSLIAEVVNQMGIIVNNIFYASLISAGSTVISWDVLYICGKSCIVDLHFNWWTKDRPVFYLASYTYPWEKSNHHLVCLVDHKLLCVWRHNFSFVEIRWRSDGILLIYFVNWNEKLLFLFPCLVLYDVISLLITA